MSVCKIGIVGGGPGGLMTAYFLQDLANAPLQLTLFEAAPRLGGKILTPRFNTHRVRYEAGAAEFYDYSHFDDDPLKRLILELGLAVHPMGGPAVVQNDRVLANLDDVRDHLGPEAAQAVSAFDRVAKDLMTPQEFYHCGDAKHDGSRGVRGQFATLLQSISHPAARQYIENMIHSDLATEPSQTTRAYGLQNYVMNDPAYMNLYGIEGGNERLPKELAARIHANVLLEHRVQQVGRKGSKICVTSRHHNETREDDFDFVVIALPHNHLPSVEFVGERLDGAFRRHHAHYDFPAHYLRVTVLFEKPFWRGTVADSYWMLDQLGGCCLYDESSREPDSPHGVLGWLLGGDAALEMSTLSDDELVARVMATLPSFLAHGRQQFVEARVHRWAGAVNAIPGGLVPQSLDRRHQPEPVEHPNLFVVGDYLFDSTLNGVLDSADYVAGWLAALLEDHSGERHDGKNGKRAREPRKALRNDAPVRPAARIGDSANQVCLATRT